MDKLQLCDLVVVNRLTKDMNQMDFHKIVRAIARRVNIVYEYTDGNIQPDNIQDPLPFDLNAPVVEIKDQDYALFYKDLTEEPKKYAGKTVRYKALAVRNPQLGVCGGSEDDDLLRGGYPVRRSAGQGRLWLHARKQGMDHAGGAGGRAVP